MNTTSSTMANVPHSANGDYVVLVHGLARTRYSMRKAQHFFRGQGYIVLNFGYPSTKYPIEILNERYLKAFIQTHYSDLTKTIHFVTHSMGGILVRFYLKTYKPDNLGRVVMLAPPNQGSEVTDWLRQSFVYKWMFGPAGQQLGTEARSLPLQLGPVEFELGIIAGDRSINLINSLKIPGQDDGKVAVERTKVQGMKDFLLVHNNHTFIMRDEHVLMQTEHFLRNGMFRRESDA
jgi:triacylglycerol lipase